MKFRLDPLSKNGISVVPPVTPVITGGTSTSTGSGGVDSVVAGTNVTVDATDPHNPIVSATGGSGSGTVTSVGVTGANGIGVSGSPVTSSGSIGLSLGAITPSSVNGVTLSGSSTPTLSVTGTSSVSGTNTGDQTSVTGNAGTATKLATARNIAGVAFDGSAAISLTSGSGIQKGDGSGGFTAAVAGTDYARPTAASTVSAPGATPTTAVGTAPRTYIDFTAVGAAITSMTTNLSGTPNRGDTLWYSFTDDGTARAITWGTSFEASTIPLPTTTVVSTRLDVVFIWNTVTSKWRCAEVF